MKRLSETSALTRLRGIKDELRSRVAAYEERAASCTTCLTPGACCLDEHFVNVHISRLEAGAIAGVVDRLGSVRRAAAVERVENAARDIEAIAGRDVTFACPLYEKGTGCLVHEVAKPVPCIVHACYEREEDLPPDHMQDDSEIEVHRLNERVFGFSTLEPLPIAVQVILRTRRMNAMTTPARSQPST